MKEQGGHEVAPARIFSSILPARTPFGSLVGFFCSESCSSTVGSTDQSPNTTEELKLPMSSIPLVGASRNLEILQAYFTSPAEFSTGVFGAVRLFRGNLLEGNVLADSAFSVPSYFLERLLRPWQPTDSNRIGCSPVR